MKKQSAEQIRFELQMLLLKHWMKALDASAQSTRTTWQADCAAEKVALFYIHRL